MDRGAREFPGKRTRIETIPGSRSAVQRRAARASAAFGSALADAVDTRVVAASGVASANSELPHREAIAESFGHHDVGGIRAAVGGEAAESSKKIGAEAYAIGDRVAFANQPDLHTAAHEAAHVVQQRAGVQLKGGVGESGDVYERHADRVADLVVAGKSAEAVLDEHAAAGGPATSAVQKNEAVDEAADAAAEAARELLDSLEQAAAAGTDALWDLIDSAEEAIAPILPQASEFLLETLWPSNSGWRVAGLVDLGVFLGAAAGVDITGTANATVTITRRGSTVVCQVEALAGGGAGGGIETPFEVNIGGSLALGGSVTVETDVLDLSWPASIIPSLKELNFGDAFSALTGLGDQFWKVSTVSVAAKGTALGALNGGVGSPAVAEGDLGGAVGFEIGESMTTGPDGTVREWIYGVPLQAGGAIRVSPQIRTAVARTMGAFQAVLPSVLEPFLQPLESDGEATRSGSLMPGPGNSANSLLIDGSLGLLFRCTTPPGSADPADEKWEVGLRGSAGGVLAILGQAFGVSADNTIMFDADAFMAMVENVANTGPKQVFDALSPIQSGFNFELTVADVSAFGAFPGFDVSELPGVRDSADVIKASCRLALTFDLGWASTQFSGLPIWQRVGDKLESFLLLDAAIDLFDELAHKSVSIAGPILEGFGATVDLELDVANQALDGMQTPGKGIIPGAEGEASVGISNVYSYTFGGPDGDQFDAAKLAALALHVLVG